MFGSLSHLLPTPGPATAPPKDVPPATPVNFPRCFPQPDPSGPGTGPREPLIALLQSIIRPTEIGMKHFQALGIHVRPDVAPEELIPDPDFIPDFAQWDAMSYDEARDTNESTRRHLNNGGMSPGVQTYQDRKREMMTVNEDAFRTVRRLQLPQGQTLIRLGNSYEFFKNLETFATFWDDTSRANEPTSPPTEEEGKAGDGGVESDTTLSADGKETKKAPPPVHFYRTESGSQMPPEYRLSILTAFLKLVAYDFGCNVSAPRTEPRLYLNAPSVPASASSPASSTLPEPGPTNTKHPPSRSSYFSSGCTFIFRSPKTREAARTGIVEGPLAAVSARHTTTFPPPRPSTSPPAPDSTTTDRDSAIDLARELVAALLTAQHRAREGRAEKRLGAAAWWASTPRWGGGKGGPIGREAERAGTPNTDDPPPGPGGGRVPAARSAKNLPMYDGYRMVRPPAPAWDRKTRYSAIGRARGAAFDDVFVVSALFHHVSVVRVRVPLRLLAVLDGEDEGEGSEGHGTVEVLRTRWLDWFRAEERVEAMRVVWGMMGYLMREEVEEGDTIGTATDGDGDVKMGG